MVPMSETMGYRDKVELLWAPFWIDTTCSRSRAFSCRSLAISSLSDSGAFPLGIHAEAAERMDGAENWVAAPWPSGRAGVGNWMDQVSYGVPPSLSIRFH